MHEKVSVAARGRECCIIHDVIEREDVELSDHPLNG
jgi:hypothetical protein